MPPRSRSTLRTEILIVGSGAIGSVFARLLVDAGIDVTMIDAGPVLSDPPGDHLRNAPIHHQAPDSFGDVVGSHLRAISVAASNPAQREDRNLSAACSLYAVGGMLTQWSCVIPRQRGAQRLTEIPSAELADLYATAEGLFGHDPRATGADPLDVVLSEQLGDAGYDVEALPLAASVAPETGLPRYTGAAQILGPTTQSPSFRLLPQHLCRTLRWRRRGRRSFVESALVVDLRQDREITVAADAVVVACNAILTPQLLHASGIWRDRLPALGRFLTEHPKFLGHVRMEPALVQRAAARAERATRTGTPVRSLPGPALTIPVDPERDRPWHTQITRDPLPPGARPRAVAREQLVQLRWFAPCEPRHANEVSFSRRTRDALGMPQPTFDFSLSSVDRRVLQAMTADCRAVANVVGGFLDGFEGKLQPLGHSLHMAGTFRIGHDPRTSACDVDSRAWGFENLYLGGNGTIPNAHAVNPTLTAAALAIRAARSLSSPAGSADAPPTAS